MKSTFEIDTITSYSPNSKSSNPYTARLSVATTRMKLGFEIDTITSYSATLKLSQKVGFEIRNITSYSPNSKNGIANHPKVHIIAKYLSTYNK
jgi:hypothetical protein